MENTMHTETVDLTPTWREVLPALLAIFESGDRRTAIDELTKMAGAADRYVALVKADRIKAEAK